MAVLGYVVRRILQGRSKGTAALTAQGAKVYVSPITRTSISWCELGERATEQDVVKCIEGLKKLSALISLARINILLAVDRFRRDPQLTAAIQTFLAGSFLDQDIID